MPGDVVRRLIQGEDSQRGYVTNTHVKCHLQVVGTNYVLCNASTLHMKPVEVYRLEIFNVYFTFNRCYFQILRKDFNMFDTF